jgi:7-carboxy-7-deazaguanine synthase
MSDFKVCEMFKSIQGESTWAGSICSFVRLSGCNLHCSYCDTVYAFDEFNICDEQEITRQVQTHGTSLVEITGGEPLLQPQTPTLCAAFIDRGYTVLVETNGSMDISVLPEPCVRIIDVKCPGSGMSGSFLDSNLDHITSRDELKYVLSSHDDFTWASEHVRQFNLNLKCTVIFSPNLKNISASECAAWILDTNAPVRLGIQLHKIIWGDQRGV